MQPVSLCVMITVIIGMPGDLDNEKHNRCVPNLAYSSYDVASNYHAGLSELIKCRYYDASYIVIIYHLYGSPSITIHHLLSYLSSSLIYHHPNISCIHSTISHEVKLCHQAGRAPSSSPTDLDNHGIIITTAPVRIQVTTMHYHQAPRLPCQRHHTWQRSSIIAG